MRLLRPRHVLQVLCALTFVLVECGIMPVATGRASRASAHPAASPCPPNYGSGSAPPVTSAAPDDFGTQQPMARVLRSPTAWTWKATLPGSRILLYYGIVGVPQGGIIGQYGDQDLLAHLRAQAQAYEQADPAHPVMMGIDVVNPVADSQPQPDGTYVTRLSPDEIQHYENLAADNHMLFYVDMQIMHSSVQRELALVWPYLQQPWGEVALDPEWDMCSKPLNGDGVTGVPLVDVGRMYASEINWVIDRLSALVVSKHLPPKVLIIHEYWDVVAPDWQNIKIKPGVQVVVCIDGVGDAGEKIYKYHLYDGPNRVQYPGFKLFYNNPLVDYRFSDHPLLTPEQVVALDPTPLMVMYQ
jgi:hypothetical protein